jgi:hypothetical protein
MKLSSLQKGLIGHWKLDAEYGMNDLTPNKNDGTKAGTFTLGATTDHKGTANYATSMIRTNGDVIRLNDSADSILTVTGNALSISYWMYPHANVYSIGFSKSDDGCKKGYVSAYYSDNKFYFGLGISNTTYWKSTTNTYAIDSWYHIVNTYDGSNMRTYVNNIQDLEFGVTGTIGSLTTKIPSIGAYLLDSNNVNNSNQGLTGSIENVRIYNRALTSTEVALLYHSYLK